MKTEEQLYEEQLKVLERLSDRVDKLLSHYGKADSRFDDGDYLLFGDYWGFPQLKVSIGNLGLLEPGVVKQLQKIVTEFPGWEIVVAVAVRGHYDDWPDMGLIIRGNEIIDGLQRRYFPKEFQNLNYEGSRPGTEND